ncbi:MAG: hypothetical protein JW901_05465 [Dehalococcoidia bacterium]|nr:hypothetical protein [Dehalococcoidia bacterium]
MSYDDLLTNTCTIRRYTEGAQDAYGNPSQTWADLHVDEPCRESYPTNREIKVGAQVVIYDIQLFLGNIDVTERDQVILNSRTYEILSASPRRGEDSVHHMELKLRTAK